MGGSVWTRTFDLPRPVQVIGVALFVLAVGGVVSSFFFHGHPRLLTEETAAIAVLRHLTACQEQVRATGRIDADADGAGEYGTFLELTGTVGVRRAPSGPGGEARGAKLDPPILGPKFAGVDGGGIVARNGYLFRIHLPAGPRSATNERAPGGQLSTPVDADLAEHHWCAYAWPEERGRTGHRAFFVNQDGEILQTPNDGPGYSGPEGGPSWDAALLPGPAAGWESPVATGTLGRDGRIWKVVN